MELEAHCRAEQVEAEAAERVKKMREQVEHWLGRVQNEYDRLRTSMDATLSHAGGELEQVRGMLDGLSAELERQDEALEGLAETCRGRNWVPGRPARCLWTLNKERQRAVAGGRPPQRERRTIGAQGDCLTDGKKRRPQAARFLYVAARRVHSIRLRYCPV